jgi:hypothetical protein
MFTKQQMLIAYRKAKFEAYRDPNCAHGEKYAAFESKFEANITALERRLNSKRDTWLAEIANLGRWTQIPKSGLEPPEQPEAHFSSTDRFEAWRTAWAKSKDPEPVKFREVLDGSVNLQILSALWCTTVGGAFDLPLNRSHVFGSRLRRFGGVPESARTINTNCFPLFHYYPAAYGAWQKSGLRKIRNALAEAEPIIAITMDLRAYYHQIDPDFMLDAKFLNIEPRIKLDTDQSRLTEKLLEAVRTLQRHAKSNGKTGLPVGLTASAVLANSLLRGFDQQILEELSPVFYGRYVDDIFLVLRPGRTFVDNSSFIKWLARRLPKNLKVTKEGSLTVSRPEFLTATLEFSPKKQKIFQLQGSAGLDLIQPIAERLREQASLSRSLPDLPNSNHAMSRRILSVGSEPGGGADALRKADSVTLRRADFARVLAHADGYSRSLDQSEWAEVRSNFVEVSVRQLLSPAGYFDLFRYIPRIFRLLARCNDSTGLAELATSTIRLHTELSATVGTNAALSARFRECWANLGALVQESVLAASTSASLASVNLETVRRIWPAHSRRQPSLWAQFRSSDWLDRSHVADWLLEAQAPAPDTAPGVLDEVPAGWGWDGVKGIATECELGLPDWRGVLFSTRGPRFSLLSQVLAERESLGGGRFRRAAMALRGAWLPRASPLQRLSLPNSNQLGSIHVRAPKAGRSSKPRIVLANMLLTKASWRRAALGTPDESLTRYQNINRLINQMVDSIQQWRQATPDLPVYLVLPELSIPRRWWPEITKKLGQSNCSIIAGVEYRFEKGPGGRREPVNEVMVALESGSVWADLLVFPQRKRRAAWEEQNELRELLGGVGIRPSKNHRVLFHHGKFAFSVLICNELTDIVARAGLRGRIDALFVPEWNQDTGGFATLVEASALDVHAFVIQANNRMYGDSRIRAPFKNEWERDVVRVKGGIDDHFVIADIDTVPLRTFQTGREPSLGASARFKPFPTGFRSARKRRVP